MCEKLDAGVTENGVMTAGICDDVLDVLLTLLKEPYRCTVPTALPRNNRMTRHHCRYCLILYSQWASLIQDVPVPDLVNVLLMWNPDVPSTLHNSATRIRKVQLLLCVKVLKLLIKEHYYISFSVEAGHVSTYHEKTITVFPLRDGHDEVTDVREVLQPEIMAASDFCHTFVEVVHPVIIGYLKHRP